MVLIIMIENRSLKEVKWRKKKIFTQKKYNVSTWEVNYILISGKNDFLQFILFNQFEILTSGIYNDFCKNNP
jgi:hypothetical protein